MGKHIYNMDSHARKDVATFRNVREPTLGVVATSRKWLPGLANALWPAKPAPTLHHLTGAPDRTCYDWCKGAVDPPSRALVTLLQSDQGWRVLEYLMRGNSQRWWLETLRARECSQAYEAKREQLKLPL